MLKGVQFWILTVIGAACLLLVVSNIALVHTNQQRSAQVQAANQYVQQSIQLQGLYKDMVNALADLSVRNKDDQLRELLSQQGITVSVNPPGTPPAATSPAGTAPATASHGPKS